MTRKSVLVSKLSVCICFIFCFINNSISQNYYTEFDKIIGNQNRAVFNGVLHQNIFLPSKGFHIFYINNNFNQGTIIFNNQPYQLPLKYDILNDEIIINHINKNTFVPINVTAAYITEFDIFSSHFVKLNFSKDIEEHYKNGFFELKFKSNLTSLYIKHIKVKYKDLSKQSVRYKFRHKSIYIVYKNGKYYQISTKKDLKVLFKDKKKMFKQYFSKEKLNTKSIIYFLKMIK